MHKILISLSLMMVLASCAPKSNEMSSTAPAAAAVATDTNESLLDVASPDEVAAELGLPAAHDDSQNTGMGLFSLQTQNQGAGLDLTQYFPVVVVVNKATRGPSHQSVKVYHRGALKYEFATSTGREQWEDAKSGRKYFSATPVGWYSPTRTYPDYFSNTWKAHMKWSVFFNGGIALHATSADHYAQLGGRASGGCVRLREENAKKLYDLILSEGQGDVPVFTRDGRIAKSLFGGMKTQKNWNTIVIVEENTQE